MIGVLNSVISAGYYVRVLVTMYMTPGTLEVESPGRRPYLFATIVFSAVATVVIGAFPALWLRVATLSFVSH